MTSNPKIICPTFNGEHAQFRPFRLKFIAFLRASSKYDPQGCGLSGFALPEAEYLLAHRRNAAAAAPFVPRPEPGVRPVLGGNPNPAAVAVHENQNHLWKEREGEYDSEQQLLEQAKNSLSEAVPDYTIAGLLDPELGFTNVTLMRMLAHLDAQFLVLPPSEIDTLISLLRVAFSPSDSIERHIGSHRRIAVTLAANHNVLSPQARYKYLMKSLEPCGIFDERTRLYQSMVATTVLQVFDTYATAILEFARNALPVRTSKAAGFVSAVLGAPSAAAHPDPQIAKLIADKAQANAAISSIQSLLQGQFGGGGGGGGGGASKGKGKGKKSKKKDPPYCWTHGCLGHASPDCRNKLPGHMDAATYTNQLGGEKA